MAGRRRRNNRDGDDRARRQLWPSSLDDSCPVVGRRGYHRGKWFWRANVDRAQHPARVGLDAAVCGCLIGLSLRCVPANIVSARLAGG